MSTKAVISLMLFGLVGWWPTVAHSRSIESTSDGRHWQVVKSSNKALEQKLSEVYYRSNRNVRQVDGGVPPLSSSEEDLKNPLDQLPPVRDSICGNDTSPGAFEVVGSILFSDNFMLVVYDQTLSAHVVYIVNPAALSYYLWMGTISLVERSHSIRVSMENLFNFDPAKSHDPPLKIDWMLGRNPIGFRDPNKPGNPGRLFLMYYDSKVSQEMDLVVLSKEQASHEKFPTNLTFKQVQVLDADDNGFMLMQCGEQLVNWCVADIQWHDGDLWLASTQIYILAEQEIASPGEGKAPFVKLLWLLMNNPLPDGARPVEWTKVNGFISAETNTVVLFADGLVYHYKDQFLQSKHFMSVQFNFTSLKLPVAEYFSCDGIPNPSRMIEPQYAESNAYKRAMLIYTLFGAHFVVAAFMIVLILLYSNKTTREGIQSLTGGGSSLRRKSTRNTTKRVRRTRKTTEEGSTSAAKSGSGSRASAKDGSRSAKSASKSGSTSSKSKSKSRVSSSTTSH